MTKISRFSNDNSENEADQFILNNNSGKYEGNCVFISLVPAETEIKEFRFFLEQFGRITNLWLEDPNGNETRQSIAHFASTEELEQVITDNDTLEFKSSSITIGICNNELKDMIERYFNLFYENNQEIRKSKAIQLLESRIIKDIRDILLKIDTDQKEQQQLQKEQISIPAADLLLSKLICDILYQIITLTPSFISEADKMNLSVELMNLIQSLTINQLSRPHIQILNQLLAEGNNIIALKLQNSEALQILSKFLHHSNVDIKNDVVCLMQYILLSDNSRNKKINPHPLFSELKQDGVIIQLKNECLISGETDEIKRNAALILGKLYQSRIVDQNMKKSLFEQLKGILDQENKPQQVIQSIKILQGLAMKESNIIQIIQDNFIEHLANHSCSSDQEVKLASLELLLILVEKGKTDVKNQVRKSIGNFGLLEMIRLVDKSIDERIMKILLNWNKKSSELKKIQEFIEVEDQYFNLQEKRLKKKLLNDKIIPCIRSLLDFVLKEIRKPNINDKQNLSLAIGALIVICVFITYLIEDVKYIYPIMIETGFAEQLILILKFIPIKNVHQIHILTIYLFSINGSDSELNKLNKLDVVETLKRFLSSSSDNIVEYIIRSMYYFMNSEDSNDSSQPPFQLQNQLLTTYPLYDNLLQDGTIDALQNCALTHNSKDDILETTYLTLILIYKGRLLPPILLNSAVQQLKKSIQSNLQQQEDLDEICKYLKFISIHQEQHETILNSGIIQIISQHLNTMLKSSKKEAIELLIILFENGDSKMRNEIRNDVPLKVIDNLIIMQNFKFNQQLGLKRRKSEIYQQIYIEKYNFNRNICALKVCLIEEQRLDQLLKIKYEIIKQLETNNQDKSKKLTEIQKQDQIEKENINENKQGKETIQELLDNNLWNKVEQMIQVVQDMKYDQQIQGSMKYVSEGIGLILFGISQRSERTVIYEAFDSLQRIVDNSNDQIILNLFDDNLCRWLHFIIEQFFNMNKSLLYYQRAITLLYSFAIRGDQQNQETNNLSDYYFIHKLYYSISAVLYKYFNDEIYIAKKQEIFERSKLLAAIASGYFEKGRNDGGIYSSQCFRAFHSKLTQFIQSLHEQSQQQLSVMNSDSVIVNQIKNQIDEKEILIVKQLLVSLMYMIQGENYISFPDLKPPFNEVISSLIHINCNCPLKIALSYTHEASELTAQFLLTLSHIFQYDKQETIELLIEKENILSHITSLIMSNLDSTVSHSSSYIILQQSTLNASLHYDNISYTLINATLILLHSIMNKSDSLRQKAVDEPNMMESIIKFTQDQEIYANNNQFIIQNNIIIHVLKVLNEISKIDSLLLNEWMINKVKIMGIISKILILLETQSSGEAFLINSIEIMSNILKNLIQRTNDKETHHFKDEILENIEKDGIQEECCLFLFMDVDDLSDTDENEVNYLKISYFQQLLCLQSEQEEQDDELEQ